MFGFGKKKTVDGLIKEGMTRAQKRARVQTYQAYYNSKVESLTSRKLSSPLLLLACKDCPIKAGDIDTKAKRDRYLKKCLKYYKEQLAIVDKEAEKLSTY